MITSLMSEIGIRHQKKKKKENGRTAMGAFSLACELMIKVRFPCKKGVSLLNL